MLADEYFELNMQKPEIGSFRIMDLKKILNVFKVNKKAKMSDFIEAFQGDLNRNQVRYLIDKMVGRILIKGGRGRGTYYTPIDGIQNIDDFKTILEGV